jgi:hypothetical protein
MTLEPFIGGACFVEISGRHDSGVLLIEYDDANNRLKLPERARGIATHIGQDAATFNDGTATVAASTLSTVSTEAMAVMAQPTVVVVDGVAASSKKAKSVRKPAIVNKLEAPKSQPAKTKTKTKTATAAMLVADKAKKKAAGLSKSSTAKAQSGSKVSKPSAAPPAAAKAPRANQAIKAVKPSAKQIAAASKSVPGKTRVTKSPEKKASPKKDVPSKSNATKRVGAKKKA